MSKIFEYMKPYSGMLVGIMVLLAIEAYCALLLPGLMADIVEDGVFPGDVSFIWRTGFQMLFITCIGVVVSLFASYFSAKTSAGVANDLREAVFKKVLRFSNAEMDRFNTSSLITRTTNDITQIQTTLMMVLRQFIYAPIIGIGGLIRALERSPSLTWVIAVSLICMLGILILISVIIIPKFKIVQKLIDRLNLVSRENLSGILIIRAFGTQRFEKKRFDSANKELAETNLFVNKVMAFVNPYIMLIFNLTTAVIVWVGAQQVSAHRADVGDIFAFLQYGMLIIVAFIMISYTFVFLPRAVVSAGRIKEVLETEDSIEFRENPVSFSKNFQGDIEFRNVNFRYGDSNDHNENVLEGINFTAKAGKTTAIIGATGAGKSTLLSLILRFYDVNSGAILVDGIDIRDLSKEELHGKIGYVPQKALLFSGTIRSNLLYANKNATDEKIREAVEIAQAKTFIDEKPKGYETEVAQGGANLSGGQKQRLSIARALVKDAPIYLFDDCFSALDFKTDALLRAALKEKTGKSTMLIVAQRISTIMDADQILVLEHGKIIGSGTHAELLKTCEVYREIAVSQLSEEELNNER